ncbi:hypothetical protein OBBRIDRAFT_737453 [Obba rivulosa]|uniref:BTB domain-containing protein n=1 Tax=Obba rivulosa TaxID=1052685 RepID=A0A8E2ALD3_9APHY|nr:hypothetical protein OBBRIDRAFT_737453 [Obba rivulosa]
MLPIIVHPPSRFSSSPPSPSSPARSITPEKRDAEQPVLADSSASALTETDKACDSAKASSRRHPEFYIQDEMKVMEVGGCLFRVHRYILEQESEYMRQLFVKDGESGSSDDAAIILADVTRQEFECLLRFLYHRTPDAHSSSPVGDLLALLSVATRLSYPKIRAHAIARLDACAPPLDPIERIILAEKHGIEQWLLPAYVAVCQRCHPLEDAEAEVLGVQTATRIARVRERILGEFIAGLQRMLRQEDVGADAPKMDDARVVRAVRDVFGL